MNETTVTFCLREKEVYLALKKRGFGAGRKNGYGGKSNPKEHILDTALRELRQETWSPHDTMHTGIFAAKLDFIYCARFNFYFGSTLKTLCHMFILETWSGEPSDNNEEMSPHSLVSIDTLPFDDMWPADRFILPRLFQGEKLTGKVYFNESGTNVSLYNIQQLSFLRLP